jgi:hypothetical protein
LLPSENRKGLERKKLNVQVATFMGALLCVLIPVVGYPAYKAVMSDPDKEIRGAEPGFRKSGMWKEIK